MKLVVLKVSFRFEMKILFCIVQELYIETIFSKKVQGVCFSKPVRHDVSEPSEKNKYPALHFHFI